MSYDSYRDLKTVEKASPNNSTAAAHLALLCRPGTSDATLREVAVTLRAENNSSWRHFIQYCLFPVACAMLALLTICATIVSGIYLNTQ